MLYAVSSNGSVGHVVSSQSNELAELYTVCGKTLNALDVQMTEDVDVCKVCDGKVDVPDAPVEDEVVTTTPIVEKPVETKVSTEGKATESKTTK